jgi:hypothetical protein
MIEKQVSFWDIIGRSEAFSEHRFQVSAQPPVKKTAGLIEKETDVRRSICLLFNKARPSKRPV